MDIIYPILAAKLKENHIKLTRLAQLLCITEKSLYNKLRGITPFTWDEVCTVRAAWFPDVSSDDLFERLKEDPE